MCLPTGNAHAPFGASASVAIQIPSAFAACYQGGPAAYGQCQEHADYGLVTLNKSFDNHLSISFDTQAGTGLIVNTAGYPGDAYASHLSRCSYMLYAWALQHWF